MGEFFFSILIFFGVITLTAFIFLIWAIARVGGWLGRVFGIGASAGRIIPSPGRTIPCPRSNCHALNNADAAYCCRCGQPMPSPQWATARKHA